VGLLDNMQATTVEILSMLGSWVSGIGAISAVIYAIRVIQPKIGARISDVNFYNEGRFIIDVFNDKSVNSHISYVRLVKKTKFNFSHGLPSQFSHNSILLDYKNKQHERVNITVEPGGHTQFKFSASSLLDAYCELQDIRKVSGMTNMVKAQIAIYLTNGSVKYVELPKSQYQKMKNVIFKAADNRVNTAIKLGRLNYLDHYSFEDITRMQNDMLNDYENTYKRHLYLLPPKGITMEDFWNNS